jgi:hypothetical protein
MAIISISEAILAINPSAEVTVNAEDLDQITWLNGTSPIAKADIEAKIAELQADYDAKQYQRDRAKVYPSIGDQLDMQYWDKINATSIWSDLITKIKSDNPKE